MTTAGKLAQRTVHTGDFAGAQQQRLAQDATRRLNSQADMLAALQNRSYAALATDVTIGIAAYATLLTANITTVLATGYLIITFSASTVHITNVANTNFRIVVDGVAIKATYVTHSVVNTALNAGMVVRVPVTRGPHTVLLQWSTNNTSARISAATVAEEHAHLLVQEAA